MESVYCLRADHVLLRKKCLLLESILQSRPEGRLAVSELTRSLQRLLEDHCKREQPFLQSTRYQQYVYGNTLTASDHAAEREILRIANQLLTARVKSSRMLVILRLSQAIEQLRIEMARQERLVFPFIDEALLNEQPQTVPIIETMSVNEVIYQFPTTQRVFDELHVNRFEEGADSMDEVAWHHGMPVSDFLQQVRHAVAGAPSDWYGQ